MSHKRRRCKSLESHDTIAKTMEGPESFTMWMYNASESVENIQYWALIDIELNINWSENFCIRNKFVTDQPDNFNFLWIDFFLDQ